MYNLWVKKEIYETKSVNPPPPPHEIQILEWLAAPKFQGGGGGGDTMGHPQHPTGLCPKRGTHRTPRL